MFSRFVSTYPNGSCRLVRKSVASMCRYLVGTQTVSQHRASFGECAMRAANDSTHFFQRNVGDALGDPGLTSSARRCLRRHT